jgi:hypothetical protein
MLVGNISNGTIILHASYVFLIYLLFLEKRKSLFIIDKCITKNLYQGEQLDTLRIELRQLHGELLKLSKENQLLNLEITHLTREVKVLSEKIKACPDENK